MALIAPRVTKLRYVLVLTGPSHAGKSAVCAELIERNPKIAVVTYDQIFFGMLGAIRETQDPPVEDFALAFEIMHDIVEHLVAKQRPTVVESTFTRISRKDNGIYKFDQELQRLLAIDPDRTFAVQLFAPWDIIESRLSATLRLDPWVVRGTWEAHLDPWPGCFRLESGPRRGQQGSPPAIADQIVARMPGGSI
jgi:hypothetical protein